MKKIKKGKGLILMSFVIMSLLISLISSIRVNEVELNPIGADSGNEWLELYSKSEVNLTGWRLVNNDGQNIILNQIFQGYLIINFVNQWLDNSDEKVILKDGENNTIDETVLLADSENDDRTWQYCDGGWIFVNSTGGLVNPCCVVPTDGMVITSDTTFCPGTYSLPNGITINANNITLDCDGAILKYENKSNIYLAGGLLLLKGDNNTIKNCIIQNSSTGISDKGTGGGQIGDWCRDNNKIINNTITSNKYNGIRLCGNNNIIENNIIKENGLGIGSVNAGIFISGNETIIRENYVENNGNRNIWIRFTGKSNIIENNQINIGGHSIELSGSYIIFRNNTVTNNSYGINLHSDNIVENNIFSNNIRSIEIYGSNNTIIKNEFISNNMGISTFQTLPVSKTNNIITKNIFKGSKSSSISLDNLCINNSIWDNDIYDVGIFDINPQNNIYCVNCIGNRYYNGATGPTCPISCFDTDGDDIVDKDDNCVDIPNPGQEDSDEDEVGDVCDLCPNSKPEEVDQYGCTNPQFCKGRGQCGSSCDLADWKGNEFGVEYPGDCVTVIIHRGGEPEPYCAGLTCAD